MTNVDSQRIREIRDNTKAMAEAFSSIASTLADALELYISTRTETQNSNLTFEKQTDCYMCKWLGEVDVCGRCRNRNLFAEADTEPRCPKCGKRGYIRSLESMGVKLKVFDEYKWKCTNCNKYFKEEPKDEPKTQMKTQNSNLTFKTLEYCDICDHKGCEECIANALDEHCMPSQFKKQIEDECAKEYEELGLKDLKELIKADRKTENNSEKPNNCEDEDIFEYCPRCGMRMLSKWYEPKDEPQTERSE